MLDFRDISIYVENRLLVRLEKTVLKRGVIALVGRNGSGKTTFIRTLLGEHAAYSGTIYLDEKKLQDISVTERAKMLAVVYSRPQIFGNHTVYDVMMLGRLPHQNLFSRATQIDSDKINEVARLLKVENWLNKSFQVLSDGEKQLVMIGRALVQDTPVILMDEPAAFLDIVNRYELSVLLKKIADETGKLIICSTHQLDRIELDFDGLLLISAAKMEYHTESGTFMKSINQAFSIL